MLFASYINGIEVYSGTCLSRLCLVPINVSNLLNDVAFNMSSTCRDDCIIYRSIESKDDCMYLHSDLNLLASGTIIGK